MKILLFIGLVIIMTLGLLIGGCSSTTTSQSPAPSQKPVTTSSPSQPITSSTTTSPTTPTATTQPATGTTKKYGGTFKFADSFGVGASAGLLTEPRLLATLWVSPCFENLVTADNKGEIIPMLATKWEVAKDLKSITFTLRQGVKFHDGSDFDATAVKWNLEGYITAKRAPNNWVSVDVIDNYTARLNLTTYTNTDLNNLASSVGLIASPTAFNKLGAEGVRYNPVGTGPFKFVSYQKDTVIKYQKFENYWQEGKPYLDAIEVYQIPDQLTRAATFQSGDLDAICGDLTQVEYKLVQQGGNVVKAPTGVAYLMGDSKNADSPFGNLKVRQAIDYAIDRTQMAQAIGYGFYDVNYQLSFSGSRSYVNDIQIRAYDVAKAKQLLADAGYPNGFNTQIIASLANTPKDAPVAVQGFLSKIGIQAEVKHIDQGSWTTYYMGGWNNGLMMALFGLDANINKTFSSRLVPTNMYNSLERSDEFMKLLQDSINSADFDPVLAQNVVRYMYDNALINVLYSTPRGAILRDYVKDTGFLTGQSWTVWYPADTWFDK